MVQQLRGLGTPSYLTSALNYWPEDEELKPRALELSPKEIFKN